VELDGAATRMAWVAAAGQPKVPVAVAATGPHVIAAAARHAERIVAVPGSLDAEPALVEACAERIAREVSPLLGE
jgi:alkanesulfonate monooxygenase SsuD/methylene tetrahydromethanopterin reductase-like flavin-dependent oxidoreductase (luciferase family)